MRPADLWNRREKKETQNLCHTRIYFCVDRSIQSWEAIRLHAWTDKLIRVYFHLDDFTFVVPQILFLCFFSSHLLFSSVFFFCSRQKRDVYRVETTWMASMLYACDRNVYSTYGRTFCIPKKATKWNAASIYHEILKRKIAETKFTRNFLSH